jgi:hypothetical protein
MLTTYAITVLIILGLMAGWMGVQQLARSFAARHPELGPAKEEGGGCGGLFCLCKEKQACPRQALKKVINKNPTQKS